MTDATWTNIVNAVVTCVLAWIAYQNAKLKSQVTEVKTQVAEVNDKAEVRAVKLDAVAEKVDEIHNSIPPNFKP